MFQNQVYITPAIAVPGDFASSNPMVFKLSGTGRMVADDNGVQVGEFAYLNADGTVSSTAASAQDISRLGFVHREFNAQITTFLAEAGYTIATGNPVALYGKGDFYTKANAITGTPVRGAKVYWNMLTGATIVGAPASPPATTIDTGFVLISESATVGAVVVISKIGA